MWHAILVAEAIKDFLGKKLQTNSKLLKYVRCSLCHSMFATACEKFFLQIWKVEYWETFWKWFVSGVDTSVLSAATWVASMRVAHINSKVAESYGCSAATRSLRLNIFSFCDPVVRPKEIATSKLLVSIYVFNFSQQPGVWSVIT